MVRPIRLISIGHSYIVALNRRLVNEIARLGAGQWEVTAIAPTFLHGDLRPIHLEHLTNEECNLQAVPIYFSKTIHTMVYSWQLQQILEQPWDLVHCWQEPYILAGGQVAWWNSAQTPLVFSTFQSYSKQYPIPFNWIEQYAMNRATGWIAFGHTVVSSLKDRPGYSLPMRLIPPGVDACHFHPSATVKQCTHQELEWIEDNVPVVGYLGRLVPEKGLHLLMRVLDRLPIAWKALIVGTGSMEAQLRTWASQYPNRVRICTDVKHQDVPKYLNAMDILCAPSQTRPNWREQFGRMIIEAFACGVPVIGSDSGEIPYVIQDAGMIVGEADEQGWIDAIAQLLENPKKRDEFATKGLERVHSVYTWSIVAQQHLEFFTELLDCKK